MLVPTPADDAADSPEARLRLMREATAGLSITQRLQWAAERFGGNLVFASSFGAEDVVLIELFHRLELSVPIITLDTGRLPQATYDLMDALNDRYGAQFVVHAPRAEELQRLAAEQGSNGFYASIEKRRRCCQVRKVNPLQRALSGVDAWITGLRRQQSSSRAAAVFIELETGPRALFKVNPLFDWSDAEVWSQIHQHDIPYNALHDQGYPSIGCQPCTRPVNPGEHPRAGRWWWEASQHKECGLHPVNHPQKGQPHGR